MKKRFMNCSLLLLPLCYFSPKPNELSKKVLSNKYKAQYRNDNESGVFALSYSNGCEENILYSDLDYDGDVVSTEPYILGNDVAPIEPTLIFGNDDRIILSNSQYSLYPFKSVCYISLSFDTDNDGNADCFTYGTGALVGHKTVLTASHVLFHTQYHVWPKSIEVIPGGYKNNNTMIKPNGFTTSYSKLTVGTYYNTNNQNDDWWLIDLNTDFGSTLGYMGVSSALNINDNIRLYGYHSDLNGKMAYGRGNVTYLETYKFRHNCDAIAGSSGGPITLGSNVVVGIHSGGYDSNQDVACKVSNYIVGWINDRILEVENE